MRALRRAGVLAAAWTSVTGCGGGYTEAVPAVVLQDEAHPTIVSLNPCTDAILDQVTGAGQLLAISSYSQDPSASSMEPGRARLYRAVSGSVEEVSALAPKVVVASNFLPPATANALRELGFKVVTMPIAATLDAARAQVRELARLAGHPERGEQLVERIDKAMTQAAPPQGAKQVSALVWESGGLVAGNDTLIADMMKHAGFANMAAARGLSQAEFLPLEQVLADPPRIIFAVGDPRAQEDRMLHHPALASLGDAMRVPLDRSLLWCGGPTIPRALKKLEMTRRALTQAKAGPAGS